MKSLFQTLGELTEKITDAGKWPAYKEAVKNCISLESKISAAESVLRTIKESRPNVTKHNGAGDNGRVSEFRESAGGQQMTEADRLCARGDAALFKALGISESDQRRLNGLPPAGENLTPSQLREYRFLRSIRLSEGDALKGARKVA